MPLLQHFFILNNVVLVVLVAGSFIDVFRRTFEGGRSRNRVEDQMIRQRFNIRKAQHTIYLPGILRQLPAHNAATQRYLY